MITLAEAFAIGNEIAEKSEASGSLTFSEILHMSQEAQSAVAVANSEESSVTETLEGLAAAVGVTFFLLTRWFESLEFENPAVVEGLPKISIAGEGAITAIDAIKLVYDMTNKASAITIAKDVIGTLTGAVSTLAIATGGTIPILDLMAAGLQVANLAFEAGSIATLFEYITGGPEAAARPLGVLASDLQAPTYTQNGIIVLDLSQNGSGISTVGLNAAGNDAYFDYTDSGFAMATAWAGPSAGVLVLDPTNSGVVLNENQIINGFSQLQTLAGAGVTTLDPSNPLWQQLRVWLGGDGLPGSGELETLAQAGVVSISLASSDLDLGPAESGTEETSVSTFTFTDGTSTSTRDLGVYSFAVDPTDTTETLPPTVSGVIEKLPQIIACGTVADLQSAMAADSSLEQLVKEFTTTSSVSATSSLVTQIIYEWTGANSVTQDSMTGSIDSRQLFVVEQFRGEAYSQEDLLAMNNQGPSASQQISTIYNEIFKFVYGALIAQGPLSSLWPAGVFNAGGASSGTLPTFTLINSYFENLLDNDLGAGANELALFAIAADGLGFLSDSNYIGFKNTIVSEYPDVGPILSAFDGTGGAPVEIGADTTSQIISGANTGGFLFGFSGTDSFKSNGGNVLEDFGNGGNDTYEVSGGDVIKDSTGGGAVWFNGEKLTGGQWNPSTNQFESSDFTYQVVNGNSLLVTSTANPSQSITIDNVPLTQNSDGSYAIASGTYLGINLTDPGTSANVPTYEISTEAGYVQTLIQGVQHFINYSFGDGVDPPAGLNVIQPEGQCSTYNLDLVDLDPEQIYVVEKTQTYNSQYYADTTGYDYEIYLKATTSGGADTLLVRMVDGADPSGTDPVLQSITFANGQTLTLGQLLSMPQVGLATDPTVTVDGSQSTIAQAGIDATYQVGVLSANVELTGFVSSAATADQLSFTSAVSEGSLSFSQSGNDLLVTNLANGSVLQVDNYLGPDTDPSVAKDIQFADGTNLTYAQLLEQLENGATPTISSGADLLQLTSTYENGDGTYSTDISGAEAYIDNLIATNDPSAATLLAQFAQALQPLENAGLVNYQAFREHYVGEGQQYAWGLDTGSTAQPSGADLYTMQNAYLGGWLPELEGDVWLNGVSATATLIQAYGALTLYGGSGWENLTDGGSGFPLTVVAGMGSMSFNASQNTGSTTFDGGTGDNVFTGGSGANFFAAHGGNDVDNGGYGANTYYLSAGFGTVVINNMGHNYQTAGNDVIDFDSSLTEEDVTFTQVGIDLVISDDYGDQALVQGYFAQPDSYGNVQTVGTIAFSDGVTLGQADVEQWDTVSTQTNSSVISAPAEDTGTTLVAWGIGSTLEGGNGDDTLVGGAGNDTLIAGSGNDYMSGKEGANIYVFGLNIGNDVIDNAAYLGTGSNIIEFSDGITADQLSLSQSGNNLVISIAGSTGSITVNQFFDNDIVEGSNPLISQIVFGDGTTWSSQQLLSYFEVATDQSPEAWGFATVNTSGPQTGLTSSTVTATGTDVVLHGGDGYVNTIDAGSSRNATIYTQSGTWDWGYTVNNNIYAEGANAEIYIDGAGAAFNDIVLGTGNSDVYIPDGGGDVQIENLTTSGGTNVLHFSSTISFQDLMAVNVENGYTVLNADQTSLALNQWNDGAWYTGTSFASDRVAVVLADGHIFDTTFYQQWVAGWERSMQYGTATVGQTETLVANGYNNGSIFAGNGTEYLEATATNAWMFGGSGVNYFYGDVNGLYSGGAGTNYIDAGSGASTIDGGLGNTDIVLSQNAASTALIRVDIGGGDDSIVLGQGSAVIEFGAGVTSSDLTFTADAAGDLIITLTGSTQTVTVQDWFEQENAPSMSLSFQDGSSMLYSAILQMLPQSGAPGNVVIWPLPGASDLFAGSGNDVLNSSYYGTETIETGPGTDVVNLNGSGSHVITVGTGSVTINNNGWDDGQAQTLVVGTGSGSIVYNDNTGGQVPLTIEFGSGISEAAVSEALLFSMTSQLTGEAGGIAPEASLSIAIAGGPTLDINAALQDSGSAPFLPTLEFSDGTIWSSQELQNMLATPLTSATEAAVAAGTNTAITNGTVPTIAAADTGALFSYTDSDIIVGSSSVQAIVADAGHAIIQANGGATDIIALAPTSTVYNGASQAWTVVESPDLVDGGSGGSSITMNDGIVLAQQGSSTMTLKGTSDVLLFDAGDGVDAVRNLSQNLTVSLGGGLSWSDLSLEQSGNDLILDVGAAGKIDLQNYFQNPGQNVQLQMFEGTDSSGVEAQLVNLGAVVAAFESAGPQTAPWSIDNALTSLALTAETNQAFGGDIAAYYALNGTLGGLGSDAAQAVLKDPTFGSAQTLNQNQWQNGKFQLLAA